jgi:hypothetical protein
VTHETFCVGSFVAAAVTSVSAVVSALVALMLMCLTWQLL